MLVGLSVGCAGRADAQVRWLSDLEYRFLHVSQGWGMLGVNTAARAADQQGAPLRIGDHRYARGLGHHAPGEIVIDLGGAFETFEAQVGLQRQDGGGSVVFRVFVDDQERFNSGVMRQDTPPAQVIVPVGGAQELRLQVEDAGDGLTCDMANWAEARLVPASTPAPADAAAAIDPVPAGTVCTSDPARTTGAQASRIQEYLAEDVFLETGLTADPQGGWSVPVRPGGQACLGVTWPEKRPIRHVRLAFADASEADAARQARLECWVGDTLWQGSWRAVPAEVRMDDRTMTLTADWSACPEARGSTRKIRVIWPARGDSVAVQSLSASSPAVMAEVRLRIEADEGLKGQPARVQVIDGCMLSAAGRPEAGPVEWRTDAPLELTVRAMRPRPWRADRTVLRIDAPSGPWCVAVDDVLEHGGVHVRDANLFVSRAGLGQTPASWRAGLSGRRTVLAEVREQEDQTLEQAMRAVHAVEQDAGPTMLSLACDNRKMIVHRDGMVQFSLSPETDDRMVDKAADLACQVVPVYGGGSNGTCTRKLEGGWLPVPVTTFQRDGILYRQRTFVAPFVSSAVGATSIGLLEITAENPASSPRQARLEWRFLAHAGRGEAAETRPTADGAEVFGPGRLLARLRIVERHDLPAEIEPGRVSLAGMLAAGTVVRVQIAIPLWRAETGESLDWSAGDLADATGRHWEEALVPAARISVPDALLSDVIRASQVHCLIAARQEAEGRRVAAWIASMHYGPLESEAHAVIRGMDGLGHHDFARRSLDYFVKRYSPEGFLTTGYTLMGTGWHLWTLGEHVARCGDDRWLRSVAGEVVRVCDWICRQRRKTMRTDASGARVPEYGLMPPAVMADWNAYAYYFCFNGYHCAGLRAAAEALAGIGHPEAERLRREAEAFREDILAAFRRTCRRTPVVGLRDGSWVRGYPSQVHCPGPIGRFFPGEDGNRSWCYDVELGAHHLVPFGILPADAPETAAMVDHMEDVQFLSDGWFDYPAERSRADPRNLGGFAKVQPYYCRIAEIHALRDDVRPFVRAYFNTLPSLLNTENLSLMEHFRGVGAWNKTHETGYFLHQTRMMLVMERGGDLWLAPFVPSGWMEDGRTVAVENLPTVFGPVGFRMESAAGQGLIRVRIDPPSRRPPQQLVVRVRDPQGRPIRRARVEPGDIAAEIMGDTVRFAPAAGPMLLEVRF